MITFAEYRKLDATALAEAIAKGDLGADEVLEAAIVGREDDEQLTKPEAFIVLNNADDAGEDLEAELLEHCKSGLARYKYPRWFNFVEDLPKTATGKIQRFKLRSD